MLEKIWNLIKLFIFKHDIQLENLFLYLFIIGSIAILILLIILIVKLNKDIKQLDKDSRKREKDLLKFLSDKKNKTY